MLINVCDKRCVSAMETKVRFVDSRQALYSGDLLLRGRLDRMAKAINLSYVEGARTAMDADAAWNLLDYFSRESSRASADFIPAMLHIAGISMEEARDESILSAKIPKGSPLLEVLGQTEHLRWNAYHFAMGYSKMTIDEVRQRAEEGITPYQKDVANRRHACLIGWDELDELSAVMSQITGKEIDYKEYDLKNIYQIPRTLSFVTE